MAENLNQRLDRSLALQWLMGIRKILEFGIRKVNVHAEGGGGLVALSQTDQPTMFTEQVRNTHAMHIMILGYFCEILHL